MSGAIGYHLKVYELDSQTLFSETHEGGLSKRLSGLQGNTTYRCELSSVCTGYEASSFIIIIDIID